MTLVLFLLASWGFSFVVSYSRVFGIVHRVAALIPPRFVDHYFDEETGRWKSAPTGRTWLGELLECPACVAAWFGASLSWWCALSPTLPYADSRWIAAALDALIAAGFCFALGTLRMMADRWMGKP